MKKITGTSQKPVLQFFTFPCIYQNPLQCNFSVTLLGGGASFTILWFWAGPGLSLVNRLQWKWWGDHSKPRPQRALLLSLFIPYVYHMNQPEMPFEGRESHESKSIYPLWGHARSAYSQPSFKPVTGLTQTSNASYLYGQATQHSCPLVLCTSHAWPVPASPTPYSHDRPSS